MSNNSARNNDAYDCNKISITVIRFIIAGHTAHSEGLQENNSNDQSAEINQWLNQSAEINQ